jgi:hypothetical protein
MLVKFQVRYKVSRNEERDRIIIYTSQCCNMFNIYPLSVSVADFVILTNNMCTTELRSHDRSWPSWPSSFANRVLLSAICCYGCYDLSIYRLHWTLQLQNVNLQKIAPIIPGSWRIVDRGWILRIGAEKILMSRITLWIIPANGNNI